jgi:hypothetical protein
VKGSFQSLGVLAACAVAWTCSVYDTDLLSLSELTGGGSTAQGGSAAGSLPLAGTTGLVAGTKSNNGGASSLAGNAGEGASPGGGTGGSDGTAGGSAVDTAGGEAGMGGDSSGPAPITCEGAPIPLKGSWQASASHSSVGSGEYDSKPEYVMDLTTKRWSTGKVQAGDEWLQIDFGASAAVRELSFTLNEDDADDYPRSYLIKLSDTPLDFNAAIRASGSGLKGQTLVVTLAEPVQGRYLLVQQKGKDPISWWSVSEVTAKCF